MLQTNEELSRSKLIGVTSMHVKDEPEESTWYGKYKIQIIVLHLSRCVGHCKSITFCTKVKSTQGSASWNHTLFRSR